MSQPRITRLQEKEEMQNLNDRLVIYIDRVRQLESENSRLHLTVSSYAESSSRGITEIKKIYESELNDAKCLINQLEKEKAKYDIEFNNLKLNAINDQKKFEKRDKEAKVLDAKLKSSESKVIEFKSRYEKLESEFLRANEKVIQLLPKVSEFEKQIEKLKSQLEEETLSRIDQENKNLTLKEDLKFKTQIYEKETEHLRHSSNRLEIEKTIDVRLRDEYESVLGNELQRIRNEVELKINQMKEQVEKKYLNKCNNDQSDLKREKQKNAFFKDELNSLNSKLNESFIECKNLQEKLTFNENKIIDLEEKLKRANQIYERDIDLKYAELEQLRSEIAILLEENQELHNVKISLDMEISAYKKLLESEEKRLNISSSSVNSLESINDPADIVSTNRSGKKRRADFS